MIIAIVSGHEHRPFPPRPLAETMREFLYCTERWNEETGKHQSSWQPLPAMAKTRVCCPCRTGPPLGAPRVSTTRHGATVKKFTPGRMSVSVAGMLHAGKEPVVEASIVKDIGTIWEQQLPQRVRDLAAFVEPDASNHEILDTVLPYAMKVAPKLTIQGGTTEVLRGIIARGLGLR